MGIGRSFVSAVGNIVGIGKLFYLISWERLNAREMYDLKL